MSDKNVVEVQESGNHTGATVGTGKRKLDVTVVDAELSEEVEKVCKDLKEENRHLMKLIYESIGLKKMNNLLEKTEEVEKGEGIKTDDGLRRRTRGGVFLYFVREEMGKEAFMSLVKQNQRERKKQKVKGSLQK